MKRSIVSAALGAAIVLGSAAAHAQHGDWQPRAQGTRIGGAFDVWPTSDFSVLAWDFDAQFAVTRVVMIDVDVPFAYASANILGRGRGEFVFGSPTAGAHWADKVLPNLAVSAGGTLSFPTSLSGTDDLAVVAAGVGANDMRAYADYYRFAPYAMSIRARGAVEWRILPQLYFRGDLTLGIHPSVNRRLGYTNALLETRPEIEYRLSNGFAFGGILQAVVQLSNGAYTFYDDRAQTALEPFIGYEPPSGHGFYFRLGLLTALDKELGFGADRDKVATVRLEAGGRL
jgi:hypothetical protein